MRIKVPFARKSYSGKSTNISSERIVNLYTETTNNPQLTFYPSNNTAANYPAYYMFPGLEASGTMPAPISATGEIRGSIVHGDKQYIVAANRLFSRTTSGTIVDISAATGLNLGTSTGLVSMASNGSFGNQIIIVDRTTTYYIYNVLANTFTAFTTPASLFLPAHNILPSHVVYMDGYFIMNDVGYGQVYISNVFDGTVFTSTNTANAEKDPDNVVALVATHKELYLIGEIGTEPWYNSGSVFPFDPIPNTYIEVGCIASRSPASIKGVVFYLGKNTTGSLEVVAIEDGKETVVSTAPIEYQFGTYVTPSDAEGTTFKINNHSFYKLSFIGQDKTWLYDITEKQWSELSSKYTVEARQGRWRADILTFFNNEYICFHRHSNNIYKLKSSVYTEGGEPILWQLTSQVFESDRDRLTFPKLDVYMEHGTGNSVAPGDDPVINLEWSDDGGHTWSNVIKTPFGKLGEYFRYVSFLKLGMSRNRIFRLTGGDPVKTVIVGLYLTVEKKT